MNNQDNRLLARLFMSVAVVALVGLLFIFSLLFFSQDQSSLTHRNFLITGGILLVIGIIAFFASRSYIKRGRNDK